MFFDLLITKYYYGLAGLIGIGCMCV